MKKIVLLIIICVGFISVSNCQEVSLSNSHFSTSVALGLGYDLVYDLNYFEDNSYQNATGFMIHFPLVFNVGYTTLNNFLRFNIEYQTNAYLGQFYTSNVPLGNKEISGGINKIGFYTDLNLLRANRFFFNLSGGIGKLYPRKFHGENFTNGYFYSFGLEIALMLKNENQLFIKQRLGKDKFNSLINDVQAKHDILMTDLFLGYRLNFNKK